eukprot:4350292-Pleurochrysis_carterae.AAC.1
MQQLSGGQKTMVALCLIFAIQRRAGAVSRALLASFPRLFCVFPAPFSRLFRAVSRAFFAPFPRLLCALSRRLLRHDCARRRVLPHSIPPLQI